MNRTLKYLSLILALLFVVAGSTMIAFAYDGDIAVVAEGEENGGGDSGGSGGIVDGGGSGGVDGGNSGIVDGGNSGGVDGGNSGIVDGGNSGGVVDGGNNSGIVDGGNNGGVADGASSNNGSAYNYTDNSYQNNSGYTNENYNYNYDEYGDGVGNEAAAGSVTSNTTLYQSSGLSDKEAAPNEWSEITLDEKTVTTGTSSFKSIKTNTNEQAGEWIVYLGYLLIGFSVLGILYFIIATIAQRSHDREMEQRERRRSAAPPRSAAGRTEEQNRRQPQAQAQARAAAPRNSRYAEEPYRSRRVSSRADTGEVYVPRRTRAK